MQAGQPVISIDTKAKEKIGNFANAGATWRRDRDEVLAHDFPSDALCKAVPYGFYDVTRNRGFVAVGTASDTPTFAVDALALWWEREGREQWPGARELLLLADAGGSNAATSRVYKVRLQQWCNTTGLAVTMAHHPAGASKWNPIEHRLFNQISRNWQGVPLRDLDTMLSQIRGTTTARGLTVRAELRTGDYQRGEKVSDAELAAVSLERATTCPAWNYTIHPAAQLK